MERQKMIKEPIFNLDDFEQEIEDAAEFSVPVGAEEDRANRAALREYNKPRTVSVTVAGYAWDQCRMKGSYKGQTPEEFMASVIHAYTSGKIMTEEEVHEIWLDHNPQCRHRQAG
ncbi:MAG: hypothetical protein LBN39_02525 [Planctomycetaceae bacterium]|jgi:hypothetical protein|nr:hypothetical protein [Planctomycetaceae bacterium]